MLTAIAEESREKLILLGGDFNCKDIDWSTGTVKPGGNINTVCDDLLQLAEQRGLSQIQREPTRERSVLDLYFTNNPGLVKSQHTIPDLSDHDMLVVGFSIRPITQTKKPRKIFNFSKANWVNARLDTTHFATRFISSSANRPVTENWVAFKDHLMKVMEDHVPSKMSWSKVQLPWITAAIRTYTERISCTLGPRRPKTWIHGRNLKPHDHNYKSGKI